jgi:hypothetical protein
MSKNTLMAVMSALVVLSLHIQPAHADSDRTFVSGLGDDLSTCTRAAPCKTFAGAIDKTNAGGDVVVVDAGGYGAFTIQKSIGIISEGTFGGILGGAPGVLIDAPGANVVLHGLMLEGLGTGAGIRVTAAATVHIRKCLIKGFKQGLVVETTSSTRVFVSDCAISGHNDGVVVKVTGLGSAGVVLDRVQVVLNSAIGIGVDGELARITLNASTITGNQTGLKVTNKGQIASYQNKVLTANSTNGNTTTTVSPK